MEPAGTNLLLSGHQAEILAAHYNHSSKILATAGIDRNILLWRHPIYENIAVLKSQTNAITSLAWTYTDKLVSSSADKTVALWDIQTQKVTRKFKGHTCIVHDVAAPKKTLELISSTGDDGCVKLWQSRSKEEIGNFSNRNKYPLVSVCFSENGQKIFAGGIDNDIKVFDVKANKLQAVIEGHQDTVSSLQLSPDGHYLLSNSFDQTLKIWDVRPIVLGTQSKAKLTKTFNGHTQGNQKGLLRASWSKDGLYIACGSIDRCVYIWDSTTTKIVQKLGGHTGTVNAVTFAQQNYLTSASNDKSIIVSKLPDIFL